VVTAGDDAAARQRAKDLRADVEIATVRELESFVAQFLLTDDGELKSIFLDEQTLADLRAHEYPILNSARTQSYADFNSSETDSKAEHVLYDALARKHIDAWDDRDKRLVSYAVKQERDRLAKEEVSGSRRPIVAARPQHCAFAIKLHSGQPCKEGAFISCISTLKETHALNPTPYNKERSCVLIVYTRLWSISRIASCCAD
jgi:hypothetical protein